MKRTHVSVGPEPILLRPAPQFPPYANEYSSYKPRGFWYEVNGDWRRWCAEEGFHLDRMNFLFDVDLGSCNILKLRGAPALDAFDEKYHVDDPIVHHIMGERDHNCIDWLRVAEEYDGLEIAPYSWARRMEFMWYYGWDCASGVIWRPRDATVTFSGVLAELVATNEK